MPSSKKSASRKRKTPSKEEDDTTHTTSKYFSSSTSASSIHEPVIKKVKQEPSELSPAIEAQIAHLEATQFQTRNNWLLAVAIRHIVQAHDGILIDLINKHGIPSCYLNNDTQDEDPVSIFDITEPTTTADSAAVTGEQGKDKVYNSECLSVFLFFKKY